MYKDVNNMQRCPNCDFWLGNMVDLQFLVYHLGKKNCYPVLLAVGRFFVAPVVLRSAGHHHQIDQGHECDWLF
jgi:hypothetical protein